MSTDKNCYAKVVVIALICFIIGYGLGVAVTSIQVVQVVDHLQIEELNIDLNETEMMQWASEYWETKQIEVSGR